MFTIILLCLIGIAVAQQPVPCISPPQWEGRIFDTNPQTKAILHGGLSYDSVYHRVRIVENIDIAGEDVGLEILTLFDAKIEFIYNVKFNNCTRLVVDAPWTDYGISPDAQSLGEAYIGSSAFPSGGLLITMWAGNFTLPTNETIAYVGTWTHEGCLPVSRLTFSEKYGNEILSFYDITAGISNPNVFIPRQECLTEEEYAMRNILFGKPTIKN